MQFTLTYFLVPFRFKSAPHAAYKAPLLWVSRKIIVVWRWNERSDFSDLSLLKQPLVFFPLQARATPPFIFCSFEPHCFQSQSKRRIIEVFKDMNTWTWTASVVTFLCKLAKDNLASIPDYLICYSHLNSCAVFKGQMEDANQLFNIMHTLKRDIRSPDATPSAGLKLVCVPHKHLSHFAALTDRQPRSCIPVCGQQGCWTCALTSHPCILNVCTVSTRGHNCLGTSLSCHRASGIVANSSQGHICSYKTIGNPHELDGFCEESCKTWWVKYKEIKKKSAYLLWCQIHFLSRIAKTKKKTFLDEKIVLNVPTRVQCSLIGMMRSQCNRVWDQLQ